MAESICASFSLVARRLMDLGLSYLSLDRAASTLSTISAAGFLLNRKPKEALQPPTADSHPWRPPWRSSAYTSARSPYLWTEYTPATTTSSPERVAATHSTARPNLSATPQATQLILLSPSFSMIANDSYLEVFISFDNGFLLIMFVLRTQTRSTRVHTHTINPQKYKKKMTYANFCNKISSYSNNCYSYLKNRALSLSHFYTIFNQHISIIYYVYNTNQNFSA